MFPPILSPCPLPALGQRLPFHADVLLSCVLHPAHVVGCSLPPLHFCSWWGGRVTGWFFLCDFLLVACKVLGSVFFAEAYC